MVRTLADRFYSGVSRYTTSGFLRIKLGEALEKRGVAAHIFESAEEAQSDWQTPRVALACAPTKTSVRCERERPRDIARGFIDQQL